MFHKILSKSRFLQFPRRAAQMTQQSFQKSQGFGEILERMEKAGIGQVLDNLIEKQVQKGKTKEQALESLMKVDFENVQSDPNLDQDFKQTFQDLQSKITQFSELEKEQENKTGNQQDFLSKLPFSEEIQKMEKELEKLGVNSKNFDFERFEQKLQEGFSKEFKFDKQSPQGLFPKDILNFKQPSYNQTTEEKLDQPIKKQNKIPDAPSSRFQGQKQDYSKSFKGQNMKEQFQKQQSQKNKIENQSINQQKSNKNQVMDNLKPQKANIEEEKIKMANFLNDQRKILEKHNFQQNAKTIKNKSDKGKKSK